MKVKTLLGIFLLVLMILFFTIGLALIQSDTDTISETFQETINIISVREHPSNNKLLIIVYEYYDPECGCYEEVTIIINPLHLKNEFEKLNTPVTIRIEGLKENNIYNIIQMRIVV